MANPLANLPVKKQRYAHLLAKGTMTKADALRTVGYSESTARNPHIVETEDFKRAFQELMRKKIPPRAIVKRIKEGMDATTTQFFTKDGKVTDSRDLVDFGERRQYTTLAAQFGGYWNPKQEIVNTRKIDESTMSRLIDLADRLDIIDEQVQAANSLYDSAVLGNGPIIEASSSVPSDIISSENIDNTQP